MKCPNCGAECEQEMVDIGVGEIPCGPAGCPECHWTENDPSEALAQMEAGK